MSIMRCEKHDRFFDSDVITECVECENEDMSESIEDRLRAKYPDSTCGDEAADEMRRNLDHHPDDPLKGLPRTGKEWCEQCWIQPTGDKFCDAPKDCPRFADITAKEPT
jgi:hypothetical protein